MNNKILSELIDHPLLTSIFASDLLVLLFHKPPFFFSLIMLGLLIALSMFFGQKVALFKN
jgi:hypothetical protein